MYVAKATFIRRLLRTWAIRAEQATAAWVIDRELNDAISVTAHRAAYLLCQAEKEWPGDPEVIRARTLLSFLKDD